MARNRRFHRTTDSLLILISGSGTGILIGLSVSPVLHIIVASVISVIVGVSAALAGLEPSQVTGAAEQDHAHIPKFRRSLPQVNPLPVTLLIVGLVLGAFVGIYVRTNQLFGPNPKRLALPWVGTGLDERDIQKRIFDDTYPPHEYSSPPVQISDASTLGTPGNEIRSAGEDAKQPSIQLRQGETAESKSRVGALFTLASVKDCQLISAKPDEKELRSAFELVGNATTIKLARECKDEPCLRRLKDRVCEK